MKRIIELLIIFVIAFPLASMAGEPATSFSGDCQCPGKKGYQRTATWADCVELCRDKSTGSSSGGGYTPQEQMLLQGAAILGNAIGQALRGNPEEDAARKAQQEAQAAEQKRKAEEQAAEQQRRVEEQARKDEEAKQRLLGSMQGIDSSSQLGLMGVDTAPGLQLMTSDQAESPSLRLDKPIQNTNDAGAEPKSAGFAQGYNDASQCFSQNAGPRCSGVATDQMEACLTDYRTGYREGDKQRIRLMTEARRVGQLAGERGETANSASNPLADGPCRVEWIKNYNDGYFQGKHAKAQKK